MPRPRPVKWVAGGALKGQAAAAKARVVVSLHDIMGQGRNWMPRLRARQLVKRPSNRTSSPPASTRAATAAPTIWWKSTSASGAPDNSSLSHFSAMTCRPLPRRRAPHAPRHRAGVASMAWRTTADSARTPRSSISTARSRSRVAAARGGARCSRDGGAHAVRRRADAVGTDGFARGRDGTSGPGPQLWREGRPGLRRRRAASHPYAPGSCRTPRHDGRGRAWGTCWPFSRTRRGTRSISTTKAAGARHEDVARTRATAQCAP